MAIAGILLAATGPAAARSTTAPSGALAAAPGPAAPVLAPELAPEMGNPRARVRVVIFEDLECPDCAHWHGVMKKQFFPVYRSRVRFEFRDFPLPQHAWAFNAAVVARYFATRSAALYFAWRDYCFTHQNELTPANLMEQAGGFAAAAGIPRAALDAAFGRADLFAAVERDQAEGARADVRHTPTILVGANRTGVDRGGALDPTDLKEATTPEQLTLMLRQALGH